LGHQRGLFRFPSVGGLLLLFAGIAYPQLTLSPSSPPSTFATAYSLPNGLTTKVYAGATMSTSGGVGAITWNTPILPPGLVWTKGGTSSTITGTPTTVGTYLFTVTVSDTQGQKASQQYSIAVVAVLAVASPLTLPSATLNTNYAIGLSATGGTAPYAWVFPASFSLNNLSPPGLTLSSTGQLSGIPGKTGTYIFYVQLSDSSPTSPQSLVATFTLTVNPSITVAGGPLPAGTVGIPYQTNLPIQGGTAPFLWVTSQGFLPNGLVLLSNGVISGTPAQTGQFSFSARVTDIWGDTSAAYFTLVVSPRLTITTLGPLKNGAVGTPYSLTFTATESNPNPRFTWSVSAGALPAGLSLTASTGLLSGTPTTAGVSNFTLQVTDGTGGLTSDAFSLTIAPQLVITTAFLPDGNEGMPYPAGQKIAATGGTPPYKFSTTGGFPAGLTLNPGTGVITGTPTQGGRISFTAQVTDSAGITATKNLVINIIAIVFTTASPLPNATFGVLYSQSISITGATAPDTFTLDSGALPAGITLSAAGTLAGTPNNPPDIGGTFNFVVRVTDASQSTATQAYQLTVAPPVPSPTINGGTSSASAQQPAATVQLASAYPLDLTVTVTLTFASAVGGVDDPAIQIVNGTGPGNRTITFTIPTGTTASPNVQFSTGTVAGTITLTFSFQTASGQNVTPTPAPTLVVQIPAAAPVITSVQTHTTSGGLEVDVIGYSNTRDMSSASFQFQATPGTNLQTSQVTISTVGQLFATWFSDATSLPYGSGFTYAQQFTISGNMSGISGVTVTLTNKQGTSNAKTATVQ
jgi:large repetitive protein